MAQAWPPWCAGMVKPSLAASLPSCSLAWAARPSNLLRSAATPASCLASMACSLLLKLRTCMWSDVRVRCHRTGWQMQVQQYGRTAASFSACLARPAALAASTASLSLCCSSIWDTAASSRSWLCTASQSGLTSAWQSQGQKVSEHACVSCCDVHRVSRSCLDRSERSCASTSWLSCCTLDNSAWAAHAQQISTV